MSPPEDRPKPGAGISRRTKRRVLSDQGTRSEPSGPLVRASVEPELNRPSESPAVQSPPSVSTPSGPKPRLKRLLVWSAVVLGALGGAGAAFAYYQFERYTRDLPSVEKLKAGYDPPQITRVFARDGTVLASLFTERRTVVPMNQIPKEAKLAFLAAEDAYFYEHEGLNYFGMVRALIANVRSGKTVQGGSTITQQVVKNVLLDPERSLRRKVREVVLAGRLEQELSKDDIFWLYLNQIYLGHGRWGIEEASRYYFGKHAKELSLDEAALLAGLIAAPEKYSPRRDPEKSLARRRYVLDQMLDKQFVTAELYSAVKKMPLRLAPAAEHESGLVPEVVDIARRTLKEVAQGQAGLGGFEVHTTIDPGLQAAARAATRGALDAYMERHRLAPPYEGEGHPLWAKPFAGRPSVHRVYTGTVAGLDDQTGTIDVRVGEVIGRLTLSTETRYNPKGLTPSEFTRIGAALRVSLLEAPRAGDKPPLRLELGPQAALVAIDVRSRDVVALVGNHEALSGGLDRATQTRRQPGSTFKAFTYSYALHSRRVSPSTIIRLSKPGYGVDRDGPLQISVRDALAHSNNEAAVALYKQGGPRQIVQWAKALGVESKLEPDLSAALGSYELTVAELANAYATFANGGNTGFPRFITRIVNAAGEPLKLANPPASRPLMTPDEAYLTTSLLRSVVRYGTGRRAKSLGREVAGKTGTTNQAKDTWFVGYSTDIVAAVWVGYDDARPLGKGESGARTALPAWIEFMKAAHEGKPKTRFARPPSVLTVEVDAATGLLPRPGQSDAKTEEFLRGTEPTELAPLAGDAGAPPDQSGESSPGADQVIQNEPEQPPPF